MSDGDADSGLYEKYEVRKDGELVENCFVLRPDRDMAAYDALSTYAHATENEKLATEIRSWLNTLDARATTGGGENV